MQQSHKLLVAAAMAIMPTILAFSSAKSAAGITDQGWTTTEQDGFYYGSQGSRLLPETWFEALEQPNNSMPFSNASYLASFGYLPSPDGKNGGRPVGFAEDGQVDDHLVATRLRWYAKQKGGERSEPWVGLNCSACHTAEVTYRGSHLRIDGGPSLTDFQSFVEALDSAMVNTKSDPAKWDRFAAKVLAKKDTTENRTMLATEFDRLLSWEKQAASLNQTSLRYGMGRVDAFGHIYNKIAMFSGGAKASGNSPDAPVSFPHLWHINWQYHVQWNGIVKNDVLHETGGDFAYGAIGRNAGEVLGVFGEVVISSGSGFLDQLKGYVSSVDVANLDRMETAVSHLSPPRWPTIFPPIDTARAARGAVLFKADCATCHKATDVTENSEKMVPFSKTAPNDLTDIWMACNAFTYQTTVGALADKDHKPGDVDKIDNLLSKTVVGVLLGRKPELLGIALEKVFSDGGPPVITNKNLEFHIDRHFERRKLCMSTVDDLLAYKARPLDGIWATAPYLHNGSVPTLYDLLLPAKRRPREFVTGNHEFDPVRVGYVLQKPDNGSSFDFKTTDDDGNAIDGNSNAGHEYGVEKLSDEDRWALVEYLKTL